MTVSALNHENNTLIVFNTGV